MKLTNVIAAGAILLGFAFAPVVTNAQDAKQDHKDVKKDERQLAKDKAKRNRAEKNGHPKVAAKDEGKVQQDKKDIHKDRKDMRKDRAAKK
jgi:hypothetical protein